MTNKRQKRFFRTIATACCVIAGIGIAGVLVSFYEHTWIDANPASRFIEKEPSNESESSEDVFPQINWTELKETNPEVVGWVSIPETPLSYPVVQAPPTDPTYYLDHDIFKKSNYQGCPYIDASCAEVGLGHSRNIVVYGHNLGHGSTLLFATIANYADTLFAQQHPAILFQTPKIKYTLVVEAVSVLSGETPSKRTIFESERDFLQWYKDCLSNAQVRLKLPASTPQDAQLFSFVTCSYHESNNERTVVYARGIPSLSEEVVSSSPKDSG